LRSETSRLEADTSRRKPLAFAVLIVLLGACSSEAMSPPEPEVGQAGAFIAVDSPAGLSLLRTLEAIRIEGDNLIFTTLYDVTPASWDEAREIAKQRTIPIRDTLVTISEGLLAGRSHRVVWFRTLTKEEEDRVR
jgi:hypothetical protein